jgi:uracil phosphoribosyltransferase/phosphoserine phosphatase
MIANLVPGGLAAFQQLTEKEKACWRSLAISRIGQEASSSGRVVIVAGHFMFWPEDQEVGQVVCTKADSGTFTHILYLDVPAEDVAQRRSDDKERARPAMSIEHLRKWQQEEKTQLRSLCYQHGILFSILTKRPHQNLLDKVSTLLCDFRHHDEEYNLTLAKSRLDEILLPGRGKVETMLVLDGDKTLTAEDTGALFWKMVQSSDEESPIKTLFSSPLSHSYTAFRQAVLLHEETTDEQDYDALCEKVALATTMHSEFVALLHAARQEHLGVVVVTCGLRHVWEKILEREGLSKTVKVIGGGRIADGFVVTAEVKAAMVYRLQDTHKMFVWAFGDSPLDVPMLVQADQSIVVVIEEQARSKTMDEALLQAIDNNGLSARQALLPSTASPRLDTTKLPIVRLTDLKFVASIVVPEAKKRMHPLGFHHATDQNAAKLLMTPMRDARVSGPTLQDAHRRVGLYLAFEYLTELIGVEDYPIPHVQVHQTSGYRLRNEKNTSIVALMRGGEPMAQGVNEAFPSAMFIHAKNPEDVKPHHLLEQGTVILVDSLVNSGKSVVEFVDHIRKLHATIRIVVVAGVVQTQSVGTGSIAEILSSDKNFSLVALRLSKNKFTGKGNTDTGNRLFNTTQLD